MVVGRGGIWTRDLVSKTGWSPEDFVALRRVEPATSPESAFWQRFGLRKLVPAQSEVPSNLARLRTIGARVGDPASGFPRGRGRGRLGGDRPLCLRFQRGDLL